MNISIFRREECAKAKGLCVVIDVLRAFTTAAFAFHRGAKGIILVPTKEEAFQKLEENPSLILIGEEHGLPIEGFHFGNSPAQMKQAELHHRMLVQRTSAGTQGVAACREASSMLLASFVVSEATIRHIQALKPPEVSFIVTGTRTGDEDLAFAEYASERLRGLSVSIEPYLRRVEESPSASKFRDGSRTHFAEEDLHLALQANRFSFVMEVQKKGSDLVAYAREPHVQQEE